MEMNTINSAKELLETIKRHLTEAKERKLPPLISVIGPTASGKTGLGIAIARKFKGEIVSADSRQIYREMSIATAKPSEEEQMAAKHYLVDCVNPDENFNLSEYKRRAQEHIESIHKKGKIPLLVGGTGLYISAVTENYELPDSKPDTKLREQYEKMAGEKGKDAVYEELQKIDPKSAESIHPNNLRYVIRALETANQEKQKGEPIYHNLFIYIDWPREELYRRIELRIDQQLEEGMLQETKRLIEKYPSNLPSLSSLGYREIGEYLKKEMEYEEAIDLFKKNTRNYAKRQLTWFRKFPKVYSISGRKLSEITIELEK